jgi:hypothetical protein
MNTKKKILLKQLILSSILIILTCFTLQSFSQDLRFYPKGNPEKWNVEITPFLVLPWVSGEVQSERLSEEFGIDPVGFIESLNGMLMMDLAVSKGKFFASAGYIYNYNEIEKILWTNEEGTKTITAEPSLQRHILDVDGGMRFRFGEKFILDPFIGIRYTHYYLFGQVDGIINTTELDEKEDFVDPVLGVHFHYYPHPRVPIELKADFGGFGVGSEFTWSAWFNTGYSVSPSVDILVGFAALSNRYESETKTGSKFGMTSITYGIDLGVRIFIPARGKDTALFKKSK